MKKTEEFLNRWKLKLMAVGVLIALSLVVVLAGFRFYSRYREQVIRTEESQLLTMAGIVGNNLDSYLEQQLDEIDLFYSQRGIPEEWAESNGIKLWTSYFLKKNVRGLIIKSLKNSVLIRKHIKEKAACILPSGLRTQKRSAL